MDKGQANTVDGWSAWYSVPKGYADLNEYFVEKCHTAILFFDGLLQVIASYKKRFWAIIYVLTLFGKQYLCLPKHRFASINLWTRMISPKRKKVLGRPTRCPTSVDSQLSFKRSILPHTVFTQEAKPPKEITSSLWIIRSYIFPTYDAIWFMLELYAFFVFWHFWSRSFSRNLTTSKIIVFKY